MNTVLIGGSDDTRSCTSAEDGPRCWASRASCEVNVGGGPNMQGVDPGGRGGKGVLMSYLENSDVQQQYEATYVCCYE